MAETSDTVILLSDSQALSQTSGQQGDDVVVLTEQSGRGPSTVRTGNDVIVIDERLAQGPKTKVTDGDVTIYDGLSTSDTVLQEFSIDFNDNVPNFGDPVGVGLTTRSDDALFDNIRLSDGTVIEDFDGCKNTSDYFDTGSTFGWDIESDGSGGCRVRTSRSAFGRYYIFSKEESNLLQSYPPWGDTVLADIRIHSGNHGSGLIFGGNDVSIDSNGIDNLGLGVWIQPQDSGPIEFRIRGDWVTNKELDTSFTVDQQYYLWQIEFNT